MALERQPYGPRMGTLLLVLAFLAIPTLSWAQVWEPTRYIGPRPTPRAIRLGKLEIYPRIETEVVYDDNIFLEAEDEQHDFITHWRPDVHARWDLAGVHALELGARADIADYSDNEQENFQNHTFEGALFLNFPRIYFRGYEYFTDTTEPSSSAAQSDLDPRTRHEDNEVLGIVGLKFGEKAKIEFDSRYFDTDYERSDLKRLELNEIGGGATFFWRIASKTNIFVGYEFIEVIFDDLDKVDPQDDSESHVGLVGLDFEPGGKLLGRVAAGAQYRDFESLEDRTIPAFVGELTWFATPKLIIAARFSREFEDPTSAPASADEFLEATEVEASLIYQLTHRLVARITGEYVINDYNTVREEDRSRAVAEIAYFIIRDILQLSVKYERIDNDSTVEADDYDVNRGSIEALLQY